MTKVRRNLFNQELVSPSKKAKMPRSRSVSAMEELKHKCQETEGAVSQLHQLILPITQQQKYNQTHRRSGLVILLGINPF